MIDMDVELCKIDFMKVINNAPSDFSALFANGRYYLPLFKHRVPMLYYDLYAYVPYNSPTTVFIGNELGDNGDALEKLLRKEEYVPCDSAFWGLAIYRIEAIKDLSYKVVKNKRSVLCEHVPFNAECRKHGPLYIAKNLSLFYEPLGWKDMIRRYLGRIIGKRNYYSILKFYYIVIRRRKDYDTPKD